MTTTATTELRRIVVIIPSWNGARASELVRQLSTRAAQPAYVLSFFPGAEHARQLPVASMAELAEFLTEPPLGRRNCPSDLLVFLHDDVTVDVRGWDQIIRDHFDAHPRCGLAGFGGSRGFAHPDIYKVRYDYRQLARTGGFISNMREAETHGERCVVPTRVAALDGFSLICTREFFERAGMPRGAEKIDALVKIATFNGKPVRNAWAACLADGIPYHLYDAWISCRAAELGYETWMLPIACHHEGGGTSVRRSEEYEQAVREYGYANGQELFDDAHRCVYERFRSTLPVLPILPMHEADVEAEVRPR